MRPWIAALVAALVVCALAPSAAAERSSKHVQVLAVMSDDAFEPAQALTVALKRAVGHFEGWSVAKGEYSLEVMVTAMNCSVPPDPSCLQKIGAKVGTDRYVWGTMKREGSNVVAVIRLWEKGSQSAETELRYSANLTDPSDDSLLKLAQGAFAKLAGVANGTLLLTASKLNGEVLVDGEIAGNLIDGRVELSLPPGVHEVRVRPRGQAERVGSVTIPTGGRAELVLNPPKPPPTEAELEQAQVEAEAEPATRGAPVAGYLALGVGGALVLGGVYSMIKVNSINNDEGFDRYRRGLGSGQDVCDQAEKGTTVNGAPSASEISDQCSQALTFERLELIFFSVGVFSLGVGTYLILSHGSSKNEKVSALRVDPLLRVGPQGGRLDVRLSF
jgi:hypothetical protein